MIELNTIGRYFRKKYGCTVYKVPISISGFTCPNIDGTVAKGGCTFCENDSFSPNLANIKLRNKLNPNVIKNPYLSYQLDQLKAQYAVTKKKLQKKFNAKKFIIYFQSFSNTYAHIDTLKALYEEALLCDDVIGISIGTRTDCMTEEILYFLQNLQNRGKEVWIEYGVQSIFDATLQRINRGHNFASARDWILKTKKYNLKICAHIVFGLPGETPLMMQETIKECVKLNIDSIKIHPLYIVKNTALARDFERKQIQCISESDYCALLIRSIKDLPHNIIIQRVTAGIDNETLLAPLWCKTKKNQLSKIKKELLAHGYIY